MAECAACGTVEEMLFACRHCERRFCVAHVSAHDCGADAADDSGERTADGESGEDPVVESDPDQKPVGEPDPDQGPVGETDSDDGGVVEAAASGVAAGEPKPAGAVGGTGARGATSSHHVAPPVDARPAGAVSERTPPVRPMDVRRPPGTTTPHRPETVAEWMRQQTYLTLAVKVGAIALLENVAFYTAVVLWLYDPLGIL